MDKWNKFDPQLVLSLEKKENKVIVGRKCGGGSCIGGNCKASPKTASEIFKK